MVLGLLVFEATVHRHQLYFRLHNDLKPPPFSIIFHGITRQHLDHGILPCIKYFINFCFYKFGLEVPSLHVLLDSLTFLTLTCTLFIILLYTWINVTSLVMHFLVQLNRGSQRYWSEDGFLCFTPFMRLVGRPVSATQEGYRGSVA